MTEQDVLDLINQFIVANGNNEITADVLRPILEAILQQPNDLIGTLSQLQTSDQSNLVNAINEVYDMFGSISDIGIRLYSGTADPNVTPPTEYNIADFYIQRDIDNNPVDLWQYNGLLWVKSLTIGQIINDDITSLNSTWSSEKLSSEIGGGTVTEVTGTSGEITVATGTTTPVISIDTAYTNSRDDYADSKVEDNLSASTTVAPSKTAVNNALSLKADDDEVVKINGNQDIYDEKNFIVSPRVPNTTNGSAAINLDQANAIANQKTITGNVTLDNTYHNCIVKVKATASITVPYGLILNFNAVFDCWSGATATFIQGTNVDIIETALTLLPGKMATLYQDGSTSGLTTEVFKLKGETS